MLTITQLCSYSLSEWPVSCEEWFLFLLLKLIASAQGINCDTVITSPYTFTDYFIFKIYRFTSLLIAVILWLYFAYSLFLKSFFHANILTRNYAVKLVHKTIFHYLCPSYILKHYNVYYAHWNRNIILKFLLQVKYR